MKLSDWTSLPPEVFRRVCQKAGGQPYVFDEWAIGSVIYRPDDDLGVTASAALASGGLAVLAGDDGEGWLVCFDATDEHGNGDWTVMDYEGYTRGYGPTLPAAVLDALQKVYPKENE